MRGRAVPRGNLAGLAERSDELELLNFGEPTEWHAEGRRDFRVYELDVDGARRLSADLFGSPLGGQTCHLSRRERNRPKHAENGNSPKKSARGSKCGVEEVATEVAELLRWCEEA